MTTAKDRGRKDDSAAIFCVGRSASGAPVTSNRTALGYSNGVRLDACGKFLRHDLGRGAIGTLIRHNCKYLAC
jgi:hypothetical protein